MNNCSKNSYPDAVCSFEVFYISPAHIKIAILAKEAEF
jgi:hypothetical protein